MQTTQIKVRATVGDRRAYTFATVQVPGSIEEAIKAYGEGAAYAAMVKGLTMQARVITNKSLRSEMGAGSAPGVEEEFVELGGGTAGAEAHQGHRGKFGQKRATSGR